MRTQCHIEMATEHLTANALVASTETLGGEAGKTGDLWELLVLHKSLRFSYNA